MTITTKTKVEVGVGKAIEIGVAKLGGEPPEWMRIFPSPTYTNDDGTFLTDDLAKALIIDEFTRRGNDLVIDYEHQTMYGGIAPAAGWIKELADRGDEGLWARTDWVERGADYLRTGEIRYFSPVYDYELDSRRIVKLHHVALTNWPRSHNLTEVTEHQIAAKARAHYGQEKGGTMKSFVEKLKAAMAAKASDARKLLTEAIGALPEEAQIVASAAADNVDLNQTLGALAGATPVDAPVASKPVLDVLELPENASLAQIQAKVIKLKTPDDVVPKAEHDRVVTELAKAKSDLVTASATTAAQQLDTLIASNRSKITPAKEKEIRAMAKAHPIAHIAEVVALMDDVLPTTKAKAEGEAPAAPELKGGAAKVKAADGREYSVNADSARIRERTKEIMKEKGVSYAKANEIRKEQDAAAR